MYSLSASTLPNLTLVVASLRRWFTNRCLTDLFESKDCMPKWKAISSATKSTGVSRYISGSAPCLRRASLTSGFVMSIMWISWVLSSYQPKVTSPISRAFPLLTARTALLNEPNPVWSFIVATGSLSLKLAKALLITLSISLAKGAGIPASVSESNVNDRELTDIGSPVSSWSRVKMGRLPCLAFFSADLKPAACLSNEFLSLLSF